MKKSPTLTKCFCLSMVLFILLFHTACGRLNQKSANEIFLKENPDYTIVHSAPGEGWDGVVNYHFDYKKPNDKKIYKEAWTFVQQDNGTWKVTGRWIPEK